MLLIGNKKLAQVCSILNCHFPLWTVDRCFMCSVLNQKAGWVLYSTLYLRVRCVQWTLFSAVFECWWWQPFGEKNLLETNFMMSRTTSSMTETSTSKSWLAPATTPEYFELYFGVNSAHKINIRNDLVYKIERNLTLKIRCSKGQKESAGRGVGSLEQHL